MISPEIVRLPESGKVSAGRWPGEGRLKGAFFGATRSTSGRARGRRGDRQSSRARFDGRSGESGPPTGARGSAARPTAAAWASACTRSRRGSRRSPHWHIGNEEMLVVLRTASWRSRTAGSRPLPRREVVALPAAGSRSPPGPQPRRGPARVLVVSPMNAPEVNGYQDRGRSAAIRRPPGAPGEGFQEDATAVTTVDLWDGEEPPPDRGS